jgi:hypothetical protein
MLKKLLPVILVNALLILLFVYSSYYIYSTVNLRIEDNNFYIKGCQWNPLNVHWTDFSYVNGHFAQTNAIFDIPNFPYWLFFISTAVNLYFIVRLARNKTS